MAKKNDTSYFTEAKIKLPKAPKLGQEPSISLKMPVQRKLKLPIVKFGKI